jgi:hypothetical protein
MRSKLLIMSTAALLAGTLAAASQNIQPGGGASGAAPEKGQQGSLKSNEGTRAQAPSAQAPKAGQQREGSELKGQTQGQAERVQDNAKGKTQGQAERVQDDAKGKAPGQAGRDQDKAKGKTQGQAERDQDKVKTQTQGQNQRDQDKAKTQTQGQNQPQGQNQRDQDRVQGGDRDRVQQGEREGRSSNTTVSFTSEQRTKIRETVFKEKNAPRVSNVTFSLNVGTVVPRTVHIVEVPEVIVTVHPEWRGYRYFIVNDEIVVVEPDTLRIVAVIAV